MHRSFWEQTMPSVQTDIAIVGGGLMGLWSAFFAKKKFPSATITVIDQHILQATASTRNAGFACFGSASEIWHDIQLQGETAAMETVYKRWEGLKLMQQFCDKAAIEWENFGGYECFATPFASEKIQLINALLQPILQAEHCFEISNTEMAEKGLTGFSQLYKNPFESQLHSGALHQFLQGLCAQSGVQFINGICIEKLEKMGAEWQLFTNEKCCLKSATVLVATNALLNNLLPQSQVTPQRGTILVTEPIDHLKLKGCFHFDEGFYYFRNIGNRILLGGARNTSFATENTNETSVNTTVYHHLESFLRTHFVQAKNVAITHSWSGIMGFTPNKLPLLTNPDTGLFGACGCNGMGVALTPVLAQEWVSIL